MAYKVRSGALNVYRKSSLREQQEDVRKAMKNADVLSLSEVHGDGLLRWLESQGFGVIRSKDDTAIVYRADKFEVEESGSETLNDLEGKTGGMRSREAAWAILRDKKTGDRFGQIAGHTTPPNQGNANRRKAIRREQYDSISRLAERLEQETGAVLVAGDLNFRSPNIKGLQNATKGGVMHTLSSGAGAVDTDRIGGLNSDHKAVVTTFNTGRENSNVDRVGRGNGGAVPKDRNRGDGTHGPGWKDRKVKPGHGSDTDGDGDIDTIDRKDMAAKYGFALAFMKSDPDLAKLFGNAVKDTWTPDEFIARLRGTDWFKKHSASVRNAILQQTADPSTYEANVDKMMATVKNAWGSTFGKAEWDRDQLRAWAETAHRMGWSEAELMDRMAKSINYKKMLGNNRLGGTAAQVESQLDSLISNYGLNLGKNWKAANLEKIIKGDDTIEGVANRVRELAKREYKAFADAIDGGATVREIADPYAQQMADLLEINPNDVDIQKDKLIQRALKATSQDGKPAAMDFSSFADMVRKDDRWQYTDNAKEHVAGVATELFRSFGLMA